MRECAIRPRVLGGEGSRKGSEIGSGVVLPMRKIALNHVSRISGHESSQSVLILLSEAKVLSTADGRTMSLMIVGDVDRLCHGLCNEFAFVVLDGEYNSDRIGQ